MRNISLSEKAVEQPDFNALKPQHLIADASRAGQARATLASKNIEDVPLANVSTNVETPPPSDARGIGPGFQLVRGALNLHGGGEAGRTVDR